MLKRKIYDSLKEWKGRSAGKSAVLIEGARRVGKSTIVKEFAVNEYDDYIFIDFANTTKDIKDNFNNIYDIDVFFRNLFLLMRKQLKERRSVIIFDEVQFHPAARQSIKYLVEDGRFDYIETGSLISIKKNVKDILIPSEEEKIQMYPMDFEEFLWACEDFVSADYIRECFIKKKAPDEIIHRNLMKRFREYMAIGGMPQAVDAFAEGKSYADVDKIKRTIIKLYEDDLKKYEGDNSDEKASVVFKTIPEQLSNHNSHFKFSLVDKNARYINYVKAVNFVNEAMIGNECSCVTDIQAAMELFADRSNFKLYMADTGLLVSQIFAGENKADDDIYKSLIFGKLGLNEGMIFENVVAQMLRSNGHLLYFNEFFLNNKKYEIDFLIVKNKKVSPIEVKSSAYRRHTSFDFFREKHSKRIGDAYIVYSKNYEYRNGITYLPIYMCMCL